jgi:hypothetical protein
MNEQVDALFEALFALTDIRVLFRETAPLHKFSDEQRSQARASVVRAKEVLSRLEEVFANEDQQHSSSRG